LDRIQVQDAQEAINKVVGPNGGPNGRAAAPPANEAARVAVGKGRIEIPIIQNILPRVAKLELATTEAVWEKIAALHAPEVRLDKASLALIRDQNPTALAAVRVAVTKSDVEDPLVRMVAKLHTSISMDTVRNEYELHRRLHEWLAGGTAHQDVEQLNDKVYAELFLTPRTDPWIGLVPADVYTGLPNNGVTPAKPDR
jgi:hypothetical protein